MSPTSQTFLEGFGNGLLLPLSGEPLLYAMKVFGADASALTTPALFLIAGFTLAQAVNWLIGFAFYRLRLRHKQRFHIPEEIYQRIHAWRFLLIPPLLLAWHPLGGVIVLITGFFRLPLWAALPAAALGKACEVWLGLGF